MMTRTIFSTAFASMILIAATPQAQARDCSVATLQGGYGFFVQAIILPAGTPRSILGRFVFDGHGGFTNTLTFNNDGSISHATDAGTYSVAPDCTGQILTNGGTRAIEIVIVDSGKEFYQLRTDSPLVLFLFNAARKQFPGD